MSVTADAAEKALANRMFHKFRKVQLAFRGYDHDHSGSIDRKEFRKIFEDVGFKLSDSEFELLMQVRLFITNLLGIRSVSSNCASKSLSLFLFLSPSLLYRYLTTAV